MGLEETGEDPSAALAERLDIGTALGNLGGDPPAFFADAAKWGDHYSTLFEGLPTQPIELMYGALGALSGGKAVVCPHAICHCLLRFQSSSGFNDREGGQNGTFWADSRPLRRLISVQVKHCCCLC